MLFGDQSATNVECLNDIVVVAVTPPQSPGDVAVTLIDPLGREVDTQLVFTYVKPEDAPKPSPAAPLKITSIEPDRGSLAGGTPVTIKGGGFAAGIGVLFGDSAPSAFTIVNESLITTVTPAHAKGVVDVSVFDAEGQSATLPGAFTYLTPEEAGLFVRSILPLSGPVAGGTRLTIEGGGFVSGTAVFFGDVAALDIAVVNEGLMTAKSPPRPAGQTKVRLRTPDGREAVFANAFTYFDTPGDSDGDGLSDAQELAGWTIAVDRYGFGADHPLALVYITVFSNPELPDTDFDGLSDYEEYLLGSDPSAEDTDHDGLLDAEEIDRWWTSPVWTPTATPTARTVTCRPIRACLTGPIS